MGKCRGIKDIVVENLKFDMQETRHGSFIMMRNAAAVKKASKVLLEIEVEMSED